MKHKIVFAKEFKEVLNNVKVETKSVWTASGFANTNDVINAAISRLNSYYEKLEIYEYEFRDNLVIDDGSSTYFGILENEANECDGYVSAIPPKYETRSGVLAQQVFPALSSIIAKNINSKDNKISNRPVYVINFNEVNFTGAMAVNVYSGRILGFGYVDIFDRDINLVLLSNGLSGNINTVVEYDEMLKKNNKQGINEYFELDQTNRSIYFLPNKLKDGVRVNNEPYWFVLRAYAALYLSINEGYRCDMTKFNILQRGNKTLDAFRNYIDKF